MANQTQTNIMQVLKSAKPTELVELDVVKERFIDLHNRISGTNNGDLIYHKEVFNYKKLLAENAALRECSQLSLYGCFLDLNVNGLSLEGGRNPDCYIMPSNHNVGTKDNPIWEKRASLEVSPYGELKMRMNSGQIKYADDPVVVYDCDTFKVGLNENGKKVVKAYEAIVPTPKEAKIIACFVRLERLDGSFEMPYLDTTDIERLSGFSNKKNKGKGANALYTSNNGQIDTGFLKAKTIKHAFKTYPKVKTGAFSSVETTEDEMLIDYGIDVSSSANAIEPDAFSNAIEEAKEENELIETVSFETVDDEPEF